MRYKRPEDTAERVKRAVLGVMNRKKPAAVAKPARAAKTAAPAEAAAEAKPRMKINPAALAMSGRKRKGGVDYARVVEPFKTYQPPPGVLPKGTKAKTMAMDTALTNWAQNDFANAWAFNNPAASAFQEGVTFLGYAYLSELTQRPEYRRISERIATEMTRKWIRLTTSDDGDEDNDSVPGEEEIAEGEGANDAKPKPKKNPLESKIKKIDAEMKRLNVRDAFRKAAELDGFFGRGHLYLDTGDTDNPQELLTSIGTGSDAISMAKFAGRRNFLRAVKPVEPIWCYPAQYNATDPLKDDWYNPSLWFAQAKQLDHTRLLTFVGRELPDILKPAYAFGGLSLSQMAKPYVDNWLRTRQAVTDLVESFSYTGLYTNMAATLSGAGGDEVFDRVDMFNNTRSNRGSMVLDKDTEEFFNIATPLGSLDALQAQSQEQMSSVSGIPLVILLGITPQGLNASSEGEIRVFYDFIHAFQELLFKDKLKRVIDFIQLSLFGEVDPAIGFEFEPLWSLDEKQQAEVRKLDMETDVGYADAGVISPEEVRHKIIADDNSPYGGLDPDDVPDLEEEMEEGFMPGAGPGSRAGGAGGGEGESDDAEDEAALVPSAALPGPASKPIRRKATGDSRKSRSSKR